MSLLDKEMSKKTNKIFLFFFLVSDKECESLLMKNIKIPGVLCNNNTVSRLSASRSHHQTVDIAVVVQLVLNFACFLQLCRYK